MTEERIMGIDYGSVRIGIAISDPTKTLATPLITLENNRKAVSTIRKLVEERSVSTLVIGYPLNLKGQRGIAVDKVDEFIKRFRNCDLEIIRWDERFSTVSAMELLHQAGVKPYKDKARIDRSAAAVILQEYLDFKKNN